MTSISPCSIRILHASRTPLHGAGYLQDPFKSDAFHQADELRRQHPDVSLPGAVRSGSRKSKKTTRPSVARVDAPPAVGHGYLSLCAALVHRKCILPMHASSTLIAAAFAPRPCLFPLTKSRVLDCILAGYRPDKTIALRSWRWAILVGRTRLRQMGRASPRGGVITVVRIFEIAGDLFERAFRQV